MSTWTAIPYPKGIGNSNRSIQELLPVDALESLMEVMVIIHGM